MKVYDVVYEVTPDAARISSYKPGVWQAGHIDFDRERAERFADEYNRHCRIEGVRYFVEEYDEESPERRPWMKDAKE